MLDTKEIKMENEVELNEIVNSIKKDNEIRLSKKEKLRQKRDELNKLIRAEEAAERKKSFKRLNDILKNVIVEEKLDLLLDPENHFLLIGMLKKFSTAYNENNISEIEEYKKLGSE